jgi:hypothetical protein
MEEWEGRCIGLSLRFADDIVAAVLVVVDFVEDIAVGGVVVGYSWQVVGGMLRRARKSTFERNQSQQKRKDRESAISGCRRVQQ